MRCRGVGVRGESLAGQGARLPQIGIDVVTVLVGHVCRQAVSEPRENDRRAVPTADRRRQLVCSVQHRSTATGGEQIVVGLQRPPLVGLLASRRLPGTGQDHTGVVADLSGDSDCRSGHVPAGLAFGVKQFTRRPDRGLGDCVEEHDLHYRLPANRAECCTQDETDAQAGREGIPIPVERDRPNNAQIGKGAQRASQLVRQRADQALLGVFQNRDRHARIDVRRRLPGSALEDRCVLTRLEPDPDRVVVGGVVGVEGLAHSGASHPHAGIEASIEVVWAIQCPASNRAL